MFACACTSGPCYTAAVRRLQLKLSLMFGQQSNDCLAVLQCDVLTSCCSVHQCKVLVSAPSWCVRRTAGLVLCRAACGSVTFRSAYFCSKVPHGSAVRPCALKHAQFRHMIMLQARHARDIASMIASCCTGRLAGQRVYSGSDARPAGCKLSCASSHHHDDELSDHLSERCCSATLSAHQWQGL